MPYGYNLNDIPHSVSYNKGGIISYNLGAVSCGNLSFCPATVVDHKRQHLAVPSSNQSEIDIVSFDTGKCHTLTPVTGVRSYGMCMGLKHCKYTSNDSLLLASYEDGSIVLWDLNSQKELSKVRCHKDAVMAFDYNETVNKGISGSATDILSQWTIKDNLELLDLSETELTNPGVNSISIRGDGRICATGGWDSQGRVFTCKRMKPLAVLSYHRASVQSTLFLSDQTLVLGSKDGSISFWNIYK